MQVSDVDLKPGDETGTFGRYRILRPLAAGGMAQILLAVNSSTGDRVVVKRILPHLAENPDFVRYFIHEGRLGQRMSHPNLVETLEAGQVGEVPYIALEYLRGKTAIDLLRAAAKQKREIPLGVAIRIVADAARGLHAAHTLQNEEGKPLSVIHRDVSPHNLFVCADGNTKVLDFGIAKAASQLHHTRTGTIKGKYAYLAPEQIRGEQIDHRVDVFALGIVLWELLTMKPLFRGKSDAEILQKVLTYDVPAPEQIRAGLPPGLGAVALRALQRDRERRLPSAQALADSIEAVAEAEGIDTSRSRVESTLKDLCPEVLEDLDSRELLVSADRRDSASASDENSETPATKVTATPAPLSDVVLTNPPPRNRSTWVAIGIAACLAIALIRVQSARNKDSIVLAARGASSSAATGSAGSPAAIGSALVPAAPAAATEKGPARSSDRPLERTAEAILRLKTDGPATSYSVDGKKYKPSSDGALHISPGRHRITVAASSLAEPRSFDVNLEPGAIESRTVHSGQGHLRLAITPWAEVSVDGKSLGVTPLKPVDLSEGTHTVTLKNDDLNVTSKQHVVVRPDRETLLKINLFK